MGKKAPQPTDPKETSAAQTGTSVATAVANAYLGNVNENTPDGSTSVSKTGMESIYDPYTGKTYEIPTFTRNTTLSPEQQAIKQQNDAASLNLSTLGNNLSGKLGTQLTDNFKLGNEATESRLMELGRARLDPALAQQDEALRTRLAQQGIKAGSLAYDREMATQGQNRNDAYTQLLLQGRNQANQEILTEDNQRINQISALLNGGQVSQPNFMGAAMPTIPTTDNASIISNYDNQKMQAWQQKQAGIGGLFTGLGNFAGSMISLSDERAKKDIEKRGEIDGMGLYEFRYKGADEESPKVIGLMAQEVKRKRPEAIVNRPDGLMSVDYDLALKKKKPR